MCSFEHIIVPNPGLTSPSDGVLFWPPGRAQLILLFQNRTDKIVAWGLDPDEVDGVVGVFRAYLRPDQKDSFVQAVRGGGEPTLLQGLLASNENWNPGAVAPTVSRATAVPAGKPLAAEILDDAIVITDNRGDGHEPRMYRLGLPVSGGAARATGTQG